MNWELSRRLWATFWGPLGVLSGLKGTSGSLLACSVSRYRNRINSYPLMDSWSWFGCSAQLFYEHLQSEDKALKRAAKAKAKEINARFTDLDGCFELGYGQLGLTVYRIPER